MLSIYVCFSLVCDPGVVLNIPKYLLLEKFSDYSELLVNTTSSECHLY